MKPGQQCLESQPETHLSPPVGTPSRWLNTAVWMDEWFCRCCGEKQFSPHVVVR